MGKNVVKSVVIGVGFILGFHGWNGEFIENIISGIVISCVLYFSIFKS